MQPVAKSDAIAALGGTIAKAAKTLDLSYQAVAKWPPVLPPAIVNRCIAHYARQRKRVPAVFLPSPDRAEA